MLHTITKLLAYTLILILKLAEYVDHYAWIRGYLLLEYLGLL